jgi:branched-chain amino acid transport system substrate-binding protein
MRTMRTHPLATRAAAALLALCLVAACGTRLSDEDFTAAGQQTGADDGGSGSDGGSGGSGGSDGDSAATDGSGTTGGDTGTAGGTDGGSGATGGATGGSTGGGGGPNTASDVGVTASTITIGNITAENGVLGDAFAPAVRGLRAWVQAINAKGGINGRQVILKTCDDREDRARTLECARRLVEQDKVFALISTNTRAMGGAAQYLNDQGIPVMGMPITNSFHRYPHFWGLYPQPLGYPRDGKTVGWQGKLMFLTGLYRWFHEEVKVSKGAVFTYDIDESKQAGEGFAQGMRLEGIPTTVFTVSFAAPSFDQAVAQMQSEGVDIIVDSMDDGANRKLCDAMARRQFKVKAKVSTIVAFGDAVGERYNDTCRNNVYIPGSSIPYTQESNPVVKEFRAGYQKYQPGNDFHQWALEAWFQGNTLRDYLLQAGGSPTRKGWEDFLRGLRKYSGGGIMTGLDYHPVDYTTPTREECFTVARWLDSEGGWVQATNKFPYCVPTAKQFGVPALEQGN